MINQSRCRLIDRRPSSSGVIRMRCQSCGRESPEQARFCGHCGTVIRTPDPAPSPPASDPDSPATVILPRSPGPGIDRPPSPYRPDPQPSWHDSPRYEPAAGAISSAAADTYAPWQVPSTGQAAPPGRPALPPTQQYAPTQYPPAAPDPAEPYLPATQHLPAEYAPAVQYPPGQYLPSAEHAAAGQQSPRSSYGPGGPGLAPAPRQTPPQRRKSRGPLIIFGILGLLGILGLVVVVAIWQLVISPVLSERATPTVQPTSTVAATAKPAAATPKPAATSKPAAAPSPTPVPAPTRVPVSLANGTDITPPAPGTPGLGKLTVKNGTNRDAVAKLVTGTDDPKTWQTQRYVYVKANDTVVLEGIRIGTYRLAFMSGVDWDTDARKFLREVSASQFEEPFEFKEEQTERGTRFSTWEVSLNPVAGGTGKTSSLPEGAFGPE